jgi:8-oxo-dGTP pyrophosphatase MutT (NUDIX family)
MRVLKKIVHKNVESIDGRTTLRLTARGIIMRGNEILLMYTKRYNDYSFPGGGVEEYEDLIQGLKRELVEETGAQNIEVISEFGLIEEYRKSYDQNYDVVNLISRFFVCRIANELGKANLEDYEIANGSEAVWVDIHEAIRHNLAVIENKESSMGFSIVRETFVLEQIVKELHL